MESAKTTGAGASGAKATAQQAKARAGERAEAIKAEARQGLDDVRQAAEDRVESEKTKAAGALAETADALDGAAGRLNAGSPQQQLLSEAARGMSALADSAQGKSVGDMVGDVAEFARRNPVAFLGGAALAGLAVARFARASDRNRETAASPPPAAPAFTTGDVPATPATPAAAQPGSPHMSAPSGAAPGTSAPVAQPAPSRPVPKPAGAAGKGGKSDVTT